ncbi:amino acid transporter-like protein [Mollisia scopiformis]|uniref:Amino acid transporter-like protein n=1 Tax=Mollisia scopiformis TaxID=149040 RepID=A0A194WZ91_MOLSC|nr:amino acid transporter-like protein [Mollisia scopiformis]KUJ12912.1 amino acid transporter-like protein [Mollisia scopiformis]
MAEQNSKEVQVSFSGETSSNDVKVDGSLEFVHEYGGNESKPSYQEASGAPVENVSPLGLQVTWFTTIFLNIGQMIGTGVFSTRMCGLRWSEYAILALGLLIAGSQLAVYVELASYFPNRSGAEVVYLEQAYPRPKYLVPTAFAVQSVLLSFSSSNAIVMAEYLYATAGHTPTAWEQKGLAVACMTFIILLVIFSTKISLRISNTVGIIKVLTLIFISITGLVVLGGHSRVKHPRANFEDSFAGTTANGYGLANALVKINFAYAGYTNAFNVVNEVKNPIKTLKKTAPASLLVVATLYILCNIAYFAAVPEASLKKSSQLAASLFFSAVFGSSRASRALNFLIALSAFGNIISVIIGSSRIIRDCGRQGVLPYPRVWASTRPFGTPLAAYALKWSLTVLMILAPPAGDAFNFIVDLQSYPANVFFFATTFGLLLIRRRRSRLNLPKTEFRAWYAAIFFSLAVNVFILVMPWYPPPGGRDGGDVTFWYATYCVVGLGILLICAIYYAFWIYILPHFGGYRIRQELIVLEDENAKTHRLVKVPVAELELWDAEHDVLGQKLGVSSFGKLPADNSNFGHEKKDD